jgi:hypothetical protein
MGDFRRVFDGDRSNGRMGAIQAYIQTQVSQGIEDRQLADRRLSQKETDNLLQVFKPIASSFPNNIQVYSVSASQDAAGYAQEFMVAFHHAGLTINGISPNDNTSVLFPSPAQISSSQVHGVCIGVSNASPPVHATQFQEALAHAGFEAPFIRWSGIGADDFVFLVTFR